MVDEFQDTNRLQMELLKLAAGETQNIAAVGDEDQSIYRWRGAEMNNILEFEDHFAGPRVVLLEENYRSTRPILELSGALISHNRLRRGKKLFTNRTDGDPVRLRVASDEMDEARWVVDQMDELSATEDLDLGSMAVLLRTNAQTRPFEEELTRRRVPYRVVGGLRFWQRAEVKDALAYLRLVVNPDDVVAFRRVVNVPARGIGAATLDVLEKTAADRGEPLPVAARRLPDGLTPRARQALAAFFDLLGEARDQRDALDPGALVGWLLESSGLLGLYDGESEEKVIRRANLEQLASAVAEAAVRDQSLEELLDAVALLEEADEDQSPEAVSLMTLHAAKGLEFDMVVLAGLEDGLLPHASSRDNDEGLEEERRLAYVGMTRARRWLRLSAARSRLLFGQRHNTQPSRFLTELPPAVYDDVSEISLTRSSPEVDRSSFVESRPVRSAPPATAPDRRPAQRSNRRAPLGPTVTDEDGNGWRPGNRVQHRRFGRGVVLSCQGRGPQLKLVVYFDRVGRKTLVPTIAKLEKL